MASTTSLTGPNLVIANSGTASTAASVIAEAEAICIYAPSTLTGTVKVQVSPDADDTASASVTWYDLLSSGAVINMATDSAVTIIAVGGFKQLRLLSGSAEGGERTFKLTLQVRNY